MMAIMTKGKLQMQKGPGSGCGSREWGSRLVYCSHAEARCGRGFARSMDGFRTPKGQLSRDCFRIDHELNAAVAGLAGVGGVGNDGMVAAVADHEQLVGGYTGRADEAIVD